MLTYSLNAHHTANINNLDAFLSTAAKVNKS